jgi:hypothetical protein
MSVPALGPFFSDDIAGFLAEYGYTANPAGLVGQYSGDFTFERDSWAWLDVNAIAVRQGDIVPDRPIRDQLSLGIQRRVCTVEAFVCRGIARWRSVQGA